MLRLSRETHRHIETHQSKLSSSLRKHKGRTESSRHLSFVLSHESHSFLGLDHLPKVRRRVIPVTNLIIQVPGLWAQELYLSLVRGGPMYKNSSHSQGPIPGSFHLGCFQPSSSSSQSSLLVGSTPTLRIKHKSKKRVRFKLNKAISEWIWWVKSSKRRLSIPHLWDKGKPTALGGLTLHWAGMKHHFIQEIYIEPWTVWGRREFLLIVTTRANKSQKSKIKFNFKS